MRFFLKEYSLKNKKIVSRNIQNIDQLSCILTHSAFPDS